MQQKLLLHSHQVAPVGKSSSTVVFADRLQHQAVFVAEQRYLIKEHYSLEIVSG
jgi:hypothetical protein